MDTIGCIGLGIMGKPMALNLLKAGFRVAVLESSVAAPILVEAGATAYPSVAALTTHVDVVITMLPDSPEVDAVVLGDEGVLHAMSAGKLFIDMSTIAPGVSKVIYEKMQAIGVEALDAPVSGGQVGAENASLSIMVGGNKDAFTRALPIFEDVSDAGFWTQGPLHPEVEAVARGSWRRKEPPAIKGTGYCVDALEAAVWAVAGATDFKTAILRAANLGDDADTTAAIAGQLAGARFGASGIPELWLELLAMRHRIETLADGLHAAATGSGSPWGCDKEFHAWWVKPGRILAGEYPGSPDPEHHDFKLAALADAGIDTIIDLTRDVERLAPYDQNWMELGRQRGRDLKRMHHPIVDCDVTTPEGYDTIVADIERELAAGRGVYVHCWGGVGRTGTVVGCWHVSRGATADEALEKIASARAGTRKAAREAPEMPSQVDMIREMADRRERSN